MNNKIITTLAALGLTKKEVDIYLALLHLGNAPASTVAKRLGLNQAAVRYTLDQLVKKSVAYVVEKNNTHYFYTKHPSRLLDILQSKEEELENQKYQLQSLLPELEQIHSQTGSSLPKVRFFEGVDGIIEMYRDVLFEAKTVFGYSRVDQNSIHPDIYQFLQKEYLPERIKIGNSAYMIFNDIVNEKYLENDKKMHRITLRVPLSKIEFRSCFHIYSDKIAFYSRSKNDLSGVLIQNENMRHDQLMLFKMAWEYARQLPENKSYKDITLPDEK